MSLGKAHELRKLQPGLPVVIMTARTEPRTTHLANGGESLAEQAAQVATSGSNYGCAVGTSAPNALRSATDPHGFDGTAVVWLRGRPSQGHL